MKKKIRIDNLTAEEYEIYARKHNAAIEKRNKRRKNFSKVFQREVYLFLMVMGFFFICSLENII